MQNEPVFDGPPPMTHRGIWIERLTPLMDRPGEWGYFVMASAGSAGGIATHLRGGRILLPDGRWEFTSRTVDGEARIYARYLGPDE